MASNSIDEAVKRLVSPETDPKLKLEAATSLRDAVDHFTQSNNYPHFLKKVMPAFINVLRGPCVFQSAAVEQRIRSCILEILHRLPTLPTPPEPFEPYAAEIVDLLITLVRTDNEENATLCVKIISDILRHQVKTMAPKVQTFLSLIQELFEQMERVVHEQLDNGTVATNAPGAPSTPSSSQITFQQSGPASPVAQAPGDFDQQHNSRPLLRGMQSFKVLSELPIIVVSIFQVYRNTVPQNVKLFVPLIKCVLCLQAKAQEQAHAEAAAKGTIFTGVSPNIKNRAAFGEFITAQVKTMSFLAYLLRQYSQQLTDFLPTLPDIVVRLLKDCPRERSSARKELLVAIRHIINFNFRKIFLPKIDELLEERTLIGDGLTVYETMRPLAYSMLADLIHHVRDNLTPAQIRKTVEVYTKNLQDPFPGTSFQTMSAKLLLNMAECIAKMPNKVDARHYLIMILNAIADKFAAMNRQYDNSVKLSKRFRQQQQEKTHDSHLADKNQRPDWDEIDIFNVAPIKTSNPPMERGSDPVVDNKFLFRNLMNGLKNTFYQLKSCNPPQAIDPTKAPQHWQDVTYGFTAEEVQVIVKLFREGAYVFRYYETEKPAADINGSAVDTSSLHMVSSGKEEKDLLETFATVFHCIDPATFHEIFQHEIPHLYEMISDHHALLHIPQFFLASEPTSASFCGMLLRFLMERIEDIGSSDVKKSGILLKLFKLAFMAVTLFATQNETVLLPHITNIVTKSIELSTRAEEPVNYFLLLRSLFRSIGGGKFEHLYKQILPLLEMLLVVLNNLLMSARKPVERDLYVELCLTVPARLSNLLPHLSYLMRPLVVALHAGTDLVGQGLRTLELCVDNLTADYLDPIMAPVIDDLTTALFAHLKPHPYSHFHAHTTVRILGKLGGRNRRFMTDAVPVTFQQYVDDRAGIDLRLHGSKKEKAFPIDMGIDLAIQKLMDTSAKPTKAQSAKNTDSFYTKHALHLINSQVKLRIGFDHLPEDLPRLVRLQAQDLLARKLDGDFSPFESSDRTQSIAKKDDQDQVLKRLLKALFFAESLPEFAEEVDNFLMSICRHFTILEVGRALHELKRRTNTSFNVDAGEGPMFLDTRVLSEAILESLSSDHPDTRAAAQRAIRELFNTAATIFGSESQVYHLAFFDHLSASFSHGCYEEEWYTKMGGTLGIHTLLTEVDLGDDWVAAKQIDFIKALLYVIKDMPQDLPEKTRCAAQTALEDLLKRITKNIKSKDEVVMVPPQPGQQPPKMSRMAHVCQILNTELSHMNRHVRETAKRSLEMIAKASNAEVWELIAPFKDRLLSPIYHKPLRALPFPTQIGFIDALTYCMTLKSDYVQFDEHLNRLLMESLALADANDDSLASKHAEYRTHQNIINLRVACLNILKTAMSFDEFMKGPSNATRGKIVSVFFKCLYQEPKATIEAANEALKSILAPTNKMPKDLLQAGLRPVLASLQNPKQLTVHGLDNLARLLRLLTSYFKVEIGARLLEHTKVLADPATLQALSFTFFEQNQSMKVIASIFNIFHLLPLAADVFLERVTDTALDLEEKLRRTQCSPFREPLYKYLNRYPTQVWTMLVGRIDNMKYGRFLAQVLRDKESQVLRTHAAGHIEDLLKACSSIVNKGQETRYAAIIDTINVLEALSRYEDSQSWMDKKEHIAWLKQNGRDLEKHLRSHDLPAELRLAANQAGEQLIAIMTESLQRAPKDLDSFFSLIEGVTNEEFRPTQTLLSYIYEAIICNESIDFWRMVILRCLDIYAGKSASQKTKRFLLHSIVNPILAKDVMEHWDQLEQVGGHRLVDRTVIDSINSKIWKVNLGDTQEDLQQPGIDHTRMEVLQLSAMLIKYHHVNLQEARKDIIRFGWAYIRLEDVINKHAAYVVLSYFIAQFETPSKIVSQIYFALLRTNQNEGRVLVMQALELLAPVLPKRCPQPDERNAVWGMGPRRILGEEGQNVQHMTNIFQFLVKHPDLFYETRDKFITLLIQSLRKVAAPPNPSNESKRLTLNMMWLIWEWEHRRVEGKDAVSGRALTDSPTSNKRKLDGDQQPAQPAPGKNEYLIPPNARLKMVRYLVEFIAQLNERYQLPSAKPRDANATSGPALPPPPTDMCKRAMTLLYNLVQPQYWGDIEFDLFPNVTEVILASDKTTAILTADPSDKEKHDEKFLTNIINTLQVVRIILNFKPDEWIVKNMEKVQKVLEKCIRSEHPEIQDCLHFSDPSFDDGREIPATIKRVLDAVPVASDDVQMEDADAEGENEPQTSEFILFLSNIATETMAANNYISGINIIWSLGNRDPPSVDQHMAALMKSLQSKLARDHVSHYNIKIAVATGQRPQDPNAVELSPYDLELQSGLILKAIEVMAKRMEVLGDNRRPFLSVVGALVEKSLNIPLCGMILQMVENWVFRSEGTWPTLKEKCAVLHKMISFEHRADHTMLHRFLELVIRIYEDPKIARTELTVRLEHAFLIGTRAQDVDMRNRFLAIFDRSLPRVAATRLSYVIGAQNWDTLQESYWVNQAITLLLGAVETNMPTQLNQDDFRIMPASHRFGNYAKDAREPGQMSDDKYEALMANHRRFVNDLGDVRVRDIIDPLSQLQHSEPKLAHEIWVTLFPMFWTVIADQERTELEHALVQLLTKDYHSRQMDKRPNVIQTLLEGAAKSWPACKIPPHVMKYEAKTFDAWYTAMVQLEKSVVQPEIDSTVVRESTMDALTDLYASLQEDDLYYGLWRRRCQFLETNSALSYEQNGMWDKAQKGYEAAQIKARTGVIPFSQAEYMLWEDHWILCAQKLQQWDILQDFAKHENCQDLLLECAWRNTEMWSNQENREGLEGVIKSVMDSPTPRRSFFQAFMSLLKLHNKQETLQDFTRLCEEAIQLSIRKWHQLPRRCTAAHIPLLQNFQQLIELHDASGICASLSMTNIGNLSKMSEDLKMVLNTWRDRLPNAWDDITTWQDLVTWRQHIFNLINVAYLQLLPAGAQQTGGTTYAYRGYHETAWIINRFAHVARKHNLLDVCVSQLSRIYTLPNIEIQEAFLKLREQAKCHFQNPEELNNGLEVINNTNLSYFSAPQKAEFYTLKGMFLEKLKNNSDADHAFGTALFYDITAAKAWAEWGYFNERRFKENPADLNNARQALTSYLQAAASYRSAKSRKLLARILWLLSMDDAKGTIAAGFDDFKGDTPTWYWITFIPQLLTALGHKEALRVHPILLKIAKSYPQALYFQLRTTREDMGMIKKNQEAKERQRHKVAQAAAAAANKQGAASGSPAAQAKDAPTPAVKSEASSRPATANGEQAKTENGDGNAVAKQPPATPGPSTPAPTGNGEQNAGEGQKKQPWELTEEIMNALKTAFPLLALSMETMVDQIQKNFKCPPDEDAYRLIVALLNDGLAYVSRMPTSYAKDVKLPMPTETNIVRFAETILPPHTRPTFEADFVKVKPTMYEYIQKLRKWRDKFEEKLDRRIGHSNLEMFSPHLSEFRFQRFEEVEVPGQYLQHKDRNQDFVRIERFLSNVDLVRTIGGSHRRLKIRGHDGSVHCFAVQHPAARHCRREERILQLFRQLNVRLSRKKESRKRDLQFTLPLMVPLAPHIRIVQEDTTYMTLQGMYEDYCRRNGVSKDEPVLFTMEKLRGLADTKSAGQGKHNDQHNNARLEVFTAIREKWVPQDVALSYVQSAYPDFAEFWLFRRRFSYQLAALTFMTYILFIDKRYPHKINIARGTGNIWGSELMSFTFPQRPYFHNPEPVPFRLTPNLVTLMGPLAMEGIFSCSLMAIARCLTEPELELEHALTLYVRDEMMFWFTNNPRAAHLMEAQLRETVQSNCDIMVKKAVTLAQAPVGNLPANQTVIDLISKAVNPANLAMCDALWMPYL